MDDLIAFLNARLDEREAAARMADVRAGANWSIFHKERNWGDADTDGELLVNGKLVVRFIAEYGGALIEDHFVKNDPDSVLADVDSKRRIIEEHTYEPGDVTFCRRCSYDDTDGEGDLGRYQEDFPCLTLRLLALSFSGHPDFREEWRTA